MKISAVIIAKDEEVSIKRCIKSLKFCDEVILIDDNSSDNTRNIASSLGVSVYRRKLGEDFSDQRNFGLSKAKKDWVLFIDADEVVTDALANEISNIKPEASNNFSGFYIFRSDVFLGKKMKFGETGFTKLIRLGNKRCGKWKRKVHEYWDINGETSELNGNIIHYPHKNLSSFVENLNHWTRLHAKANKEEGKSVSMAVVVFYPIAKFIRSYFLKLGFLDGVQGLVHASFMSLHSFLAWSSMWLDKKRK